MKGKILQALKLITEIIIFPLSRWYNSNLFLYAKKSVWLKERPSFIWLVFGRIYLNLERLGSKFKFLYFDSILSNYSRLITKHYLNNYAYNQETLSDVNYQNEFRAKSGSMKELFGNKFLVNIAGIGESDSFLDCGCGLGSNINEILLNFPCAKVAAFDISPNAVAFVKEIFKEKNVQCFQGSVLDMNVFNKFADHSIDNVFFANMLATILSNGIEETMKVRKAIIMQALRIAKKNVIINEICTGPAKIYIEQKYRAIFQEDYSVYLDNVKDQGDILLAPKIMIFHKKS